MWFSRHMSLAGLIDLCRALRHYLGAGLSLRDVFRQQAQRGLAAVRPVAARVSARLEKGKSLEDALKREAKTFRPLFVDLAILGEQTGNLPEIFAELEEYYRQQQTLTRKFRSKTTLPVLQFVLAVAVVAVLLYVLGAISEGRGHGGPAPLGVDFRGKQGAFLFLASVVGLLGIAAVGYFLFTRVLLGRTFVDQLLLRLPAVGPCLEAFALNRFTVALRLTLETGMSIREALRLSLRATGHGAFIARTSTVVDALEKGDDLTLALGGARIFPEELISILAVAEESGRIPEVMRSQARYYQEEASRRLTTLTRVATLGVWLFYLVFMTVLIVRTAAAYFDVLPK